MTIEDVSLNDPLPEDPRLTKLRSEGWTDSAAIYGEAFCGPCGNAVGLMTRNGEVQCKGCLIWGHPSFAYDEPGDPYEDIVAS